MRCYICDRALSETEIAEDPRHGTFDPCSTCLTIISEIFSDPLDEDEITYLLEEEEPEVFSSDKKELDKRSQT